LLVVLLNEAREVYKRQLNTRDDQTARILDAAARKKNSEDQLRRTTRQSSNALRLTVGFNPHYKIFAI
jgi:hypothetical protein